MIELGPLQGPPTDLLRLLVVPVFAWAAVHDVRTRRLPNRMWPPLYAFGALLLVWDGYQAWGAGGFEWQQFAIGTAISVGLVIPLVYVFWLMGGFGGADVKAIGALAVLFPTFPTYFVGTSVYPLVDTNVGSFAFTILTNAVVVGVLYPVGLALYNVVRGERSAWMLVGLRKRWDDLPTTHGRLLEKPEGRSRDGLDLDALRMYLQWRGIDLADVRERPAELRDPATLPEEPSPPGDGAVVTDGGTAGGDATPQVADEGDGTTDRDDAPEYDDPWGAEAFVDWLGYEPYGTAPNDLRDGLEAIARKDRHWVSPGIPFIVPVFVGLLAALTYGDLLFGVLQWIGIV